MATAKRTENNSDFIAKEKLWLDIVHKISSASGMLHMVTPNLSKLVSLLINNYKNPQIAKIMHPKMNEQDLEVLSKSIESLNTARMNLSDIIATVRERTQKITTIEDLHALVNTLPSLIQLIAVIRTAVSIIKNNFSKLLEDYNRALEKNLVTAMDKRDQWLLGQLPEGMANIDTCLTTIIDLIEMAQREI